MGSSISSVRANFLWLTTTSYPQTHSYILSEVKHMICLKEVVGNPQLNHFGLTTGIFKSSMNCGGRGSLIILFVHTFYTNLYINNNRSECMMASSDEKWPKVMSSHHRNKHCDPCFLCQKEQPLSANYQKVSRDFWSNIMVLTSQMIAAYAEPIARKLRNNVLILNLSLCGKEVSLKQQTASHHACIPNVTLLTVIQE